MRTRAWLIIAGLLLPREASAMGALLRDDVEADTCFARTYSAAHLARNPTQKTLSMRVALRREAVPDSIGVEAMVLLRPETVRRGDKRRWKAIAGCRFDPTGNVDTQASSPTSGRLRNPAYPRKDAIACQVTGETLGSGDRGDFLIKDVVGGAVVYINDSITMRTASTVSASTGRDVTFGGEDAVFSLDRAPKAACADLHAALKYK